ncbi:MAG TPA: hypothetical protein VMM84_05620 [Pyrinomonadaceae bacterium]|nr:hypothetical protein [Pyrinomonadaceae bacterium]
MNQFQVQAVEILSPDLVPFIGESDVSMILASVQEVKLVPRREGDIEVEAGTVGFQLLEVFRSDVLSKGGNIEVPAKRMLDRQARARNNFDQWNNLSLNPGELVVLAVRPLAPPKLWQGLAALAVDSPVDPKVSAVHQCYAIEEFTGPPAQKKDLVRGALMSSQEVLRFYALDAVGRRAILGRQVGASLIAEAITSPKTAPDDRLELGMYLTRQYFFDKGLADDRANRTVVAALAQGMVNETNPERRLEWSKYLASCILPEFSLDPAIDKAQRSSLVKSVQQPAAGQVISVLSGLLTQGATDEREIVRKLLEAWRAA